MQHCSPDQLALAALREPLPAEDSEHLAACGRCRDEVASLQRAVDVLAVPSLAAPGPAVPPPARVWESIAAATGVSVSPRAEPPEPAPPMPAPFTAPPPEATGTPEGLGAREGSDELARRRRPPSRRWLAVAAALLVGGAIGAGAVAATLSRDDGGSVIAQTALDPLDDDASTGRAAVREEDSGRVLAVELDAPELDDGYYEVWLLQSDAQRMVQVGVVRPGATVLPLPAGLDLGAYPLVDVSVEPLDGVPTHSGVSVARGQLET